MQNNINLKVNNFYNPESQNYTNKRYPKFSTSYVQFFFKKRLDVLKTILETLKESENIKNIYEVGCADGVVTVEISKIFNESKIVSVDLSPEMIKVANQKKIVNVNFYVRDSEPKNKYDLLVVVGVFNLIPDPELELENYDSLLNPGGILLLSLAQKESIYNIFYPFAKYFNHLESIDVYGKLISKNFELKEKKAYGLFIPHLWKLKKLANCIQNLFEYFFYFRKNFYHETLYVLKKR